jgi:hypothetical protein
MERFHNDEIPTVLTRIGQCYGLHQGLSYLTFERERGRAEAKLVVWWSWSLYDTGTS